MSISVRISSRFENCLDPRSIIGPAGANPSAEDQDEALEDGAKTVIDVVDSFLLRESSYDKAGYQKHLKVGHCRSLSLQTTAC